MHLFRSQIGSRCTIRTKVRTLLRQVYQGGVITIEEILKTITGDLMKYLYFSWIIYGWRRNCWEKFFESLVNRVSIWVKTFCLYLDNFSLIWPLMGGNSRTVRKIILTIFKNIYITLDESSLKHSTNTNLLSS